VRWLTLRDKAIKPKWGPGHKVFRTKISEVTVYKMVNIFPGNEGFSKKGLRFLCKDLNAAPLEVGPWVIAQCAPYFAIAKM